MRHSPLLSRLGYYKWSNRFRDWRCNMRRIIKYRDERSHRERQSAEPGDRIEDLVAYNACTVLTMHGHDAAKLHVGPYIFTILVTRAGRLFVRYEEGPQ